MSKVLTNTASMQFNAGTQRANSSTIMNYTNRKVASVGIKTDTIRLAFSSITGETKNISSTNTDFTNIFSIVAPGAKVVPSVSTFTPDANTEWDYANITAPVYNGAASLVSLYGHIVVKLSGSETQTNVIQLGIFVNDVLVGTGTPGYVAGTSPYTALAIPDLTGSTAKGTTDLTVNIVVPLVKGYKIELKARQSHSGDLPYEWFQANLYGRPIELTGTELGGIA